MELSDNYLYPVDWRKFDHEQRKKTIAWLSERLGKKFYGEMDWFDTKYVVPNLERKTNLCNMGYNTDENFRFLLNAICMEKEHTVVLPYVERLTTKKKMWMSKCLRLYATEKKRDEMDKKHGNDMFASLGELVRVEREKELENEMKEKGEIVCYANRIDGMPADECEYFTNEKQAVEDVKFCARILINAYPCRAMADAYLNNEIDWTKPNKYTVTKKTLLDKAGSFSKIKKASWYEKVFDENLTRDFREFLKTI